MVRPDSLSYVRWSDSGRKVYWGASGNIAVNEVMFVSDDNVSSPRFAAVYIRVSTEDQAELSPDSQLEEIEKYARREGLVILRDHVYIDAGISGKKAERRPEFMRMIAAAKEKGHPFSVILLWKYSRFARNQEESIFYKSILRSKCGVDVVSITEPLIAGPFGSLIERIIEWMDEFYSIRLSQEVKRSMSVNARRGKLQCTPPFGFRVEDGRLVPKEDEAVQVRRMFDSFLAGKGLYPIARELNSMGVRTHRGNRFENRTVEYILRNPVYIGKLRWNPTGRTQRDFFSEALIIADGEHAPLVSQESWEAVQHRLNEMKDLRGYKARPAAELKSWLSGLVRCSACGAALVFTKPHYYKCGSYAKGRCTQSQHIRADLLEDSILSRLTADAAGCRELSYKIAACRSREGDSARLKAALRQIQNRKARLREAYLAGVLELDEFAAARRETEQEEEKVRQELERPPSETDKADARRMLQASIAAALKTMRSSGASLEQKNNAARAVIENCIFDKSASALLITYRFLL